ncbi:MAG TPA: glycoside hydrolase family 2 protein [Chitinophagaceae bacterium]|nr:glycoside hydrolase family 2 protein [Chitinophagaceae bacterium]
MRLVLLFIFFTYQLSAQSISIPFNSSWEFRKTTDPKWYNAEVPGTVHTDLLTNKLIPDPFYRDNEKLVQWVEKEDWEYKTRFTPPPTIFSKKNIELVFDGLDTYAKIYLNGLQILEADNMFRQWRVDVRSLLKKDQNELRIVFSSAVKHDDSLGALNPLKLAGENNRMYSRKAQYQYGWDWGPRLVTCGIYKTIRWEAWDTRRTTGKKEDQRWDVQLVDKPDSIGRTFYFNVNGKPTFIKGANWIPCESFLPRARKLDLYRKLIKAAKEANINMLRVWGGGVYEDDMFYDLCDEYGIMVWQDFMFAGALYPGDEKFLENVEEEVRYQVKRLKHHPCIVIWCGNNEIEEAWNNWGWQSQFNYSASDSTKLWSDYKKIFHQLIPSVLKELDPGRPYWPSSPSLGWGREQAYKQGDVHYWGVWWGKEPVEKYNDKVGRFNSEYGMQAFPDMKTIRQFALLTEMDTASSSMRAHQKHPFGYPNIKMYIENRFRTPKNFEDLVYVSQLMQADAIKTAIEAHRRAMPFNMGTMFWQWNDCWPVVSWSAVDYYGRKKAMYYEVKRSFKETVFLPYYDENSTKYYLKGANDLDTVVQVKGEFYDFIKGDLFDGNDYTGMIYPVKDPQYFTISSLTQQQKKRGVYCFRVIHKGKELSRNYLFAYPPKQLELPQAKINYQLLPRSIILSSDKFAYGVYIDVPDGVELEDNYFHLLPKERKIIKFSSTIPLESIRKQIKIKSLVDTY